MAYTTNDTKLGDLLNDPAATMILDKHFPGIATDPRIGMAKGMTLRTVQKFAKDIFIEDALDKVDAEFAKLKPGEPG